jgi:hypothetical protein
VVCYPFIEPRNETSHRMEDLPNGTTSHQMKDPPNRTPFKEILFKIQHLSQFSPTLSIIFYSIKNADYGVKKTVLKKTSFRVLARATSHARHLYVCAFCRFSILPINIR